MSDTKAPQVSHELHPVTTRNDLHQVSTVVRDHIAEQGAGHETDVVLLDAGAAHLEKGQLHGLKLAKDNHTVLIPQPSSDPNDPLNWSWRKKHMMLFIISLTGFLGDFASGAGIPLIFPQGEYWHMSPLKVNESGNLNVLMLGIGGLFWIVISNYWGRAPVMFWSTLLGLICTLVCAVATNYNTYYAFRALMGVTLTAYQITGLAVVKDMFFFHEHARKIGIWVACFILSPYLSPFFANFMLAADISWRAVFWLVFAVIALDLVFIVGFGDESFYNRSAVYLESQPDRGSRLMRVLGIWQLQHRSYFPSLGYCVKRLLKTISRPIVLPACLYYCMSFMWSVGINITSSILLKTPTVAGGYGCGNKQIGFVYFTPLVAVATGEFIGHFLNDFIANRYVKSHGGLFKPEARLYTSYLGGILMIPGLIIVGQTLEKHLSVAGIVMGWGIYTVGVVFSSIAVTAYLLDSYPTASSEIAGFLNFARVIGGFSVGYFQSPWGEKQGYAVSFGIQAAIVGCAVIIIFLLQRFGGALRTKGGQP